jgi:hypothetical protein
MVLLTKSYGYECYDGKQWGGGWLAMSFQNDMFCFFAHDYLIGLHKSIVIYPRSRFYRDPYDSRTLIHL